MAISSSTRALTNSSGQSPKKVATIVNDLLAIAKYNASEEASAAAATGALSVAVRTSNVTLDGTDARSLAAPTFAGQYKTVQVVAGANTPVLVLTVAGMTVATQNVWTSGTFHADTGPLSITFYSGNGTSWDLHAVCGSWTVA